MRSVFDMHGSWAQDKPELAKNLHCRDEKKKEEERTKTPIPEEILARIEGRRRARQQRPEQALRSAPVVETPKKHVELPRDVVAYFTARHHDLPAREPGLNNNEYLERVELALMDDLWKAYLAVAESEDFDEIRRTILTISHERTPTRPAEDVTLALLRHIRDTETDRETVSRFEPNEREMVEERLMELQQIQQALERNVTGEQLRDAASRVEGEMSSAISKSTHGMTPSIKTEGKRELADLRLVRDEIYARLLSPKQAQADKGVAAE